MYQNILKDIYLKRCNLAIRALKANGFDAMYVDNSKDALRKVLSLIPEQAKVGIGGSVTIWGIGLLEAIKKQGNDIYAIEKWEGDLSLEEKYLVRKEALLSDIYLTSSNAITLNGQLVNVDGTGNRVAALIFGPKKTIVIAGANKIVDTLEDAFARIRSIACPLNAMRLNLKTPCALTGMCTDCNYSGRMCKVTVILDKKPNLSDITVVLVGESLGF